MFKGKDAKKWKKRIFVNSEMANVETRNDRDSLSSYDLQFANLVILLIVSFPIRYQSKKKSESEKSYLLIIVERNESIFRAIRCSRKSWAAATSGKVAAEIFSHASLIVHRLKVRGELATPLHMRAPFRDVLHVRQHTRCRDVTD